MERIYNVLDLFSGAGGLTLGFNMIEDFKIKLSIDNNEKLSETYVKNFPEIKHLNRDINSFTDEEIEILQKKYKFDLIIGGPPCQGFSLAGKIGRKEIQDERNNLFLSYLKFVKIIKPKLFIMENVATLLRHNKGKTFDQIKKAFENLGYKIHYKILNASDYEIAQNRQRIFIIGTSSDKIFEFPSKLPNKISIKEVIDDLPKLGSGEGSNLPNHIAMNHSEQMLEKMSYVKDGGDRTDIPENIRPASGDVRKYIRYNSTLPSICITGDMRKVFHYSQNRALTNRELARIQSFPDSFIFYGSSIAIQQQIGNAVPPKLSNILAKKIKEFLDE